MATIESAVREKTVVGVQLDGDDLARFLNQKARRHLKADSECMRQLAFERIEQLEREQAADGAQQQHQSERAGKLHP